MSHRRRSIRTLTALTITTGLLLGSLVGPALGKLATVTVTATAVPSAVTPGANVAIDATFYNSPSTSNIAQLFMSATTPSGWTLVGVESQTQGVPCDDSTATVTCTLGAVNAGASVTVRVVYTTPSDGSGNVQLNWFLFNTTGVAGDPRGNSHGDNYRTTGSVMLNASDDFGGAYTSNSGQTVADYAVLHARRNPQSTSVTSPDDLIGVMVGEVPGTTFACPAVAGTCFGQWSIISVDDGTLYPGGFVAVLAYKGNIGDASFFHAFDDYDALTNPDAYELIRNPEDTCSDATPDSSELPCLILSSSGGDSFATLYLTQTGRLISY